MNQPADHQPKQNRLPISLPPVHSSIAEHGAQAAQPVQQAPAGIGAGSEEWVTVGMLPFASWKEALQVLEKKIARMLPASAGKFGLWFAPMPLERIQQRGGEVRLRFTCTSQKRKQEVLALQAALQALLAEEYFPGRQVQIELSDPGDERPFSQLTPSIHDAGPQTTELAVPENTVKHQDPIATEPLEPSQPAFEAQPAIASSTGLSQSLPTAQVKPQAALARLDEILLEPSYATTYDEIVRAHSAVYLPAYFVRHLRHMGAADGLRYMALRQVAYLHGLREANGSHLLPVTVKELSRWSTLQPRRIYGGLEDTGSYLYLLAGKAPYLDYYATRPPASRWEDEAGYHWKSGGREYCIWKRGEQPGSDCSQLMPDRATGELQWRQAPLIYRVQLSMPLCPEDEQTLRGALLQFGAREDPLNAIRKCLALPRNELLPDRPAHLSTAPRKLYTVQELVMECWGRLDERELAARVAVQAKLLETHLLQPERDLLKIPFYLLEKWGPYLSPAQLWTAILAMDHVYAGAGDGAYRDTTILRNGIKEMMLWTEDQYSKGAARKISKWLYPFNLASSSGESIEEKEPAAGEHFNPWFSVFVSEVLSEKGARVKNADNSVQMKLRVLPVVPLCPEDTLHFARRMGLERLAVRDAAGLSMALEITAEELAVYLPDGRTLRYSYTGELRYGEPGSLVLHARSRQLDGIDLLTGEDFYSSPAWPGALFGNLENGAGVLSGSLESRSGALYDHLERKPGALSGSLANEAGALFGELTLDPGALFGMLLKLLILNLYGIKQNADSEKTPSNKLQPENIDALEQFGSRQGQFIQWAGVEAENVWDFDHLVKSLGIGDVRSLAGRGVTPLALASTALELFAAPAERFNSGRIAVLVARLRTSPHPDGGVFLRIADQGPQAVQDCLRRAILNVSPLLNEPDWDQTLGKARRDDLIELAERLGLARVFRQ